MPEGSAGSSRRHLDGTVALVTGGGRGLGRAIALRLAQDGVDVLVNYRQRAEAAAATVAQIQALGRRALAVQANMANPDDIARMFELLVEAFGGLDFLICNAAAGIPGPLMDATLRSWDLAMNVNARSLLLCAQAAAPLMRARGGGRIIALGARIGTEHALPGYGTIAASKAALSALTKYLAVELGPHRIIVNTVSPGLIDTEAVARFDVGPRLLQRTREATPSGRPTTPEDVAHLVAFLCSAEAYQINGQVIEIDGGYGRVHH